MITLTTEQAQQIEEALVEYRDTQMIKAPRKALSIIRAARAQEQAEQEPVAWKRESDGALFSFEVYDGLTPLYAAPVRTKDLTDDEIDAVYEEWGAIPYTAAIRAVIAAYKEKNK